MPKKRKRQEEYVDYIVRIEDWDWALSFGLGTLKWSDEAYMDHRHLEIEGTLLHPTNAKTNRAHLTLIPRRDCHLEKREGDVPRAVASLDVHHGVMHGLLTMPLDALCPLISALIAERLRYVMMHGSRLRYRQALIRSYRFELNPDPDDLPEGIEL